MEKDVQYRAMAVPSRQQVFCHLYTQLLAVTFVVRAKVMSLFSLPSHTLFGDIQAVFQLGHP